tara:strand:+ start:227 stop:613 length:387 start_codon:yes stop_codon:yes gene_type:complete
MINIKLKPINFSLIIFLFLLISIFIFFFSSKIVFSKELNKNFKKISSPEEELAIRYCDATNKNIFNGLDKEELLKYKYYFSSLKMPRDTDSDIFFKNFLLKVKSSCSYNFNEAELKEFISYIKLFLKN